MTGCVSPVMAPSINDAAIRVLTRHGIEVVIPSESCCGAMVHHMGRSDEALLAALDDGAHANQMHAEQDPA